MAVRDDWLRQAEDLEAQGDTEKAEEMRFLVATFDRVFRSFTDLPRTR
jgi:predicted secreted protein